MTARDALAKAVGALDIVADVEADETHDAFRVTFMDGRRALVDWEVGQSLAAIFDGLEQKLKRTGVRPAW